MKLSMDVKLIARNKNWSSFGIRSCLRCPIHMPHKTTIENKREYITSRSRLNALISSSEALSHKTLAYVVYFYELRPKYMSQ